MANRYNYGTRYGIPVPLGGWRWTWTSSRGCARRRSSPRGSWPAWPASPTPRCGGSSTATRRAPGRSARSRACSGWSPRNSSGGASRVAGTDGRGPGRSILYARVSTDEQAKKGYSLPGRLRRLLREHAGEKAYEVVMEAVNDGYEGDSLWRPGIDRV